MMILIKISGPKLRGLMESYQSSVKIEKMFQAGPGPGVAGGCAVQGVLLLLTGPSPHTPVRLFKGSHIASFRQYCRENSIVDRY